MFGKIFTALSVLPEWCYTASRTNCPMWGRRIHFCSHDKFAFDGSAEERQKFSVRALSRTNPVDSGGRRVWVVEKEAKGWEWKDREREREEERLEAKLWVSTSRPRLELCHVKSIASRRRENIVTWTFESRETEERRGTGEEEGALDDDRSQAISFASDLYTEKDRLYSVDLRNTLYQGTLN